MSLRNAAKTIDQKIPGPKCGVGKILLELDPDDIAYFDEMVTEGRSATYMSDVLKEDGHTVSHYTVRRHTAGRCSCR